MFGLVPSVLVQTLFSLSLFLFVARLFGTMAEKIWMPRVMGEVMAGYLIGPHLLGLWMKDAWKAYLPSSEAPILGFLATLGLLFLMLDTGFEFEKPSRLVRSVHFFTLIIITTIPALITVYVLLPWTPLIHHVGSSHHLEAFRLILSISVAITAVPILAKLFQDLNITHTRFAQTVISVASFHDLLLWGALSVALAWGSSSFSETWGSTSWITMAGWELLKPILITLMVMTFSFIITWLVLRLTLFQKRSVPLCVLLLLLFFLSAWSYQWKVEGFFVPLLIGVTVRIFLPEHNIQMFKQAISPFTRSWLAPLFFVSVGYQLTFGEGFTWRLWVFYMLFALSIQGLFVFLGSKLLMRQSLRDSLHYAIVFSERGIPGIVVASIAYQYGLIDQALYTTLVLFALFSALVVGIWFYIGRALGWVLPGGEHMHQAYPNVEASK
ncbi:MAG: Na(+)/H(+) antiporter [Candidatus Carbobacillus altaicus]|uniref:Na(+)/H(+) antiporter n=1 Tax=Candidatus Carbonibacillus altaicus TaxID=2163959 RepID=A0A2R6Y0V6_9BACL|nr:MAG: Na(+)/H(+) antiporter [Candidatus Carbobacillus altaicus]